MLGEQQARRVQALAAQLGAPPSSESKTLMMQHTAAQQPDEHQYSVVLPEALTTNQWVVRRQVSGVAVGGWSEPAGRGAPAQAMAPP